MSVALERAKETIYIEDWWLSPELFMRRPPFYNQEWRLDQILKRKAEEGVQIYVIVYREVEVSKSIACQSPAKHPQGCGDMQLSTYKTRPTRTLP